MHDLILFMYSLRSRGLSADPASRIARGCGSSADPKLADPDYPRIQIFWIRTSLVDGPLTCAVCEELWTYGRSMCRVMNMALSIYYWANYTQN
jgi:hypothetical protein